MPQLKRGEQGSVLVAVLGLSIIMSMAAASLILVAGNSRNDEDNTLQRLRCRYDAESGLMLGAGWLRNRPNHGTFITLNNGWVPTDYKMIYWYTLDNGSWVTVSVLDSGRAGSPPGFKVVTSIAKLGTDSVRLSWDIGYDATAAKMTMSRWREF
ncbi:MAG: hypothetical protein ABI036_02205 [Fibrobacteria bacterium]